MVFMNLWPDLFADCERPAALDAAISSMAEQSETGRGAVFTRLEVVNVMLTLAGYTVDRPLHQLRLLEPSFGAGDFLLPAVDRLWEAYVASGGATHDLVANLSNAIRGVELHHATFEATSRRLLEQLTGYGMGREDASTLCRAWLVRDDFLLTSLNQKRGQVNLQAFEWVFEPDVCCDASWLATDY